MISLKSGVIPDNGAGIVIAMIAVNQAFQESGEDCVITAMMDGVHSRNSLHYAGNAVDFRTRDLRPKILNDIVKRIKASLNEHYDVILHDTHLHVEFQPRRPKGPL